MTAVAATLLQCFSKGPQPIGKELALSQEKTNNSRVFDIVYMFVFLFFHSSIIYNLKKESGTLVFGG